MFVQEDEGAERSSSFEFACNFCENIYFSKDDVAFHIKNSHYKHLALENGSKSRVPRFLTPLKSNLVIKDGYRDNAHLDHNLGQSPANVLPSVPTSKGKEISKKKQSSRKEQLKEVKPKKINYYKELSNMLVDKGRTKKLKIWGGLKCAPTQSTNPNPIELVHSSDGARELDTCSDMVIELDTYSDTAIVKPQSCERLAVDGNSDDSQEVNISFPVKDDNNQESNITSPDNSDNIKEINITGPDYSDNDQELNIITEELDLGSGEFNKASTGASKHRPNRIGRLPKVINGVKLKKGRFRCGIVSCIPCSISMDCGECNECIHKKIKK